MYRIEPHIVADHQMLAVALRRGHHALALRQRHSHGLLAQHVLARVQRSRADLRVAAVLHADGHCVDVRLVDELIKAVVDLAAVLGGHFLGPGHVFVVIRHDLRIGVGCVLGKMAYLCDLAAADDADSDHKSVPPQKILKSPAAFRCGISSQCYSNKFRCG